MNPPAPEKPRPAPRDSLPWLLGGGALVLGVACVAGILFMMTDPGSLPERLAREINAFEGAPWPRPSHASHPTPGTFAEALGPLMPEFEEIPISWPEDGICPHVDTELEDELTAYDEAGEALTELCSRVAKGKAPLADLPMPCFVTLHESREVLHRVLAATRAEVGGLPAGLGSLSRPDSDEHYGFGELGYAVELAGQEMRLLAAWGQTVEAVDTCMDALALSREMSLGGGLFGLRLADEYHDHLYLPCAEVLDVASVERKREALEQLARLRQGYAPLSAALREESVYRQLRTYGALLPPQVRDTLPEIARDLIDPEMDGVYFMNDENPRLRPYAWRRNVAIYDAMIAAADLPAAERRQRFRAIDTSGMRPWMGSLWSAQLVSEQLDALERHRIQALALAALVEVDLARAARGEWPAALPPELSQAVILEADSSGEAWLVPRSLAGDVPALRVTADAAPEGLTSAAARCGTASPPGGTSPTR
jgi:hypothetical protein